MLYYYYKYFFCGVIFLAAGKTHDKITVIMTPFIASFFLFINMIFLEDLGSSLAFTILGVSVYMFGGYMFSGDLDIKSREFRRWGYLKFIWIPYQKLFEHRSVFYTWIYIRTYNKNTLCIYYPYNNFFIVIFFFHN